jgi:penicillin amidase
MRKFFRGLFLTIKIVVVVAVLAALATAGGVGWLFYRAMPDYSGAAPLPGLSAAVKVVRDEHGVPHIFAANMNDAARALGYVHAGDRFFQMEVQRRAGQGRLSEIFGSDTLDTDKLTRTLGLYLLAQNSIQFLSPEARDFFQAYADGVNAWLDTHRDKLPPEFLLLDLKPEPWTIADSLVWGKLMALQLSKNYELEALRAQLGRKLSPQQMADLFPGAPANVPVTIEPQGAAPEPQKTSSALDTLAAITGLDHPASNEWVIAGSRTESGKPILANDPHLGLGAPILWYLARIVTPDLSIEGATVPGLPIVLLGQNGHMAWGFTTTGSDVEDLFVETFDPKNPDMYQTPDGWDRFRLRPEIIRIKGGKTITLEVRMTRHGPVISDIDPDIQKIASYAGGCVPTAPVLSPAKDAPATAPPPPFAPEKFCLNRVVTLAFTGLGARDTTPEALMRLDRAQNPQQFLDALRLYQAPTQNIVYADTDGDIGFINPGLVPIRKAGNGTVPVDGATEDYAWTSLIPFAQLPQIVNPPAGYIFNANNAPAGPSYPYFLGVDWEEPWRADRLQQYFNKPGKHTLDSSAMMQADHVSLAARVLLPSLLKAKPEGAAPAAAQETKALDLLKKWDGLMDKDRAEPLIFEAWLYEMHKHLLVEKTGSPLTERGPFAAESIDFALNYDPKSWCAAPDCGDVIKQSFADAIHLLIARDGPDIAQWRWGNEHVATLHNKFWSHIPFFRDWSKLDVASSGDFYTLDRGGSEEIDPDHPFARTHGGGYRGIYDLGDPDKSRFMIATGESGHIFSRHYGDLVSMWNNVQSFTLTGTQDELVKKGLPELTLTPARR